MRTLSCILHTVHMNLHGKSHIKVRATQNDNTDDADEDSTTVQHLSSNSFKSASFLSFCCVFKMPVGLCALHTILTRPVFVANTSKRHCTIHKRKAEKQLHLSRGWCSDGNILNEKSCAPIHGMTKAESKLSCQFALLVIQTLCS